MNVKCFSISGVRGVLQKRCMSSMTYVGMIRIFSKKWNICILQYLFFIYIKCEKKKIYIYKGHLTNITNHMGIHLILMHGDKLDD